jgi:hypothetical protein
MERAIVQEKPVTTATFATNVRDHTRDVIALSPKQPHQPETKNETESVTTAPPVESENDPLPTPVSVPELSMLQSIDTTAPRPPGYSGEFNINEVLKNIISPAPRAK